MNTFGGAFPRMRTKVVMCIDPAATGLAIQYNSRQAGKFDDDGKP